jgi:hypothetical protein
VQENAKLRPDIIKIWVDDRDNTVPKLTPELYGAIIDEAHKQNVRVTAHIFDLEDGKGCSRPMSMRSRTACVTATLPRNS